MVVKFALSKTAAHAVTVILQKERRILTLFLYSLRGKIALNR